MFTQWGRKPVWCYPTNSFNSGRTNMSDSTVVRIRIDTINYSPRPILVQFTTNELSSPWGDLPR
jgi:hypothetical protein